MSDEEFLKRWSRRKQEAKAASEAAAAGFAGRRLRRRRAAGRAARSTRSICQNCRQLIPSRRPPTSPHSCAKIFPLELSRAALRRAWAADPAIRDFVGLAENAWDFTDPTAMPGFGAARAHPGADRRAWWSASSAACATPPRKWRSLPVTDEAESPRPEPRRRASRRPDDARPNRCRSRHLPERAGKHRCCGATRGFRRRRRAEPVAAPLAWRRAAQLGLRPKAIGTGYLESIDPFRGRD